jgi:hypothetical protein
MSMHGSVETHALTASNDILLRPTVGQFGRTVRCGAIEAQGAMFAVALPAAEAV